MLALVPLDQEYSKRYYEALDSFIHNGILENSLDEFKQLISFDKKHTLADNCQYWIGEIFYNRKEYENALDAFYKVFEFEDNNKEYYAQYKIALCYLSLDDIPNALKEFQNMIDNHPADSDLVKKSKRLIDKYSNN